MNTAVHILMMQEPMNSFCLAGLFVRWYFMRVRNVFTPSRARLKALLFQALTNSAEAADLAMTRRFICRNTEKLLRNFLPMKRTAFHTEEKP